MRTSSYVTLLSAILFLVTRGLLCRSTTCLKSDFVALADFKSGLKDPENRLVSWHRRNCCQWRGIECNNNTGAVTSIDLRNPHPLDPFSDSSTRYGLWNLSGEIRPSLLQLKSLRYLDLSSNTFGGITIPEFLGFLNNLRYLNLSRAGFTGSVPSSLGNLSSLQYLDVSSEIFGPTVDSLDWVTGLVSLKYIALDGVDLSTVGSNFIEKFNQLPFLTELHLSNCGLPGPVASPTTVNFTSLTVIDLGFNSLNSLFPDWLTNVTSLEHLDLNSCGLIGRIPLALADLQHLKFLNLAPNNYLSASCHELFGKGWERIEYLGLGGNKLHGRLPASVGNMTLLSIFDISDNNVMGSIPSSIFHLCNLQRLELSGNNLSGHLPNFPKEVKICLSGHLPFQSLLYLELSNNHLGGNLPDWLGQLQGLVELSLSYNAFQGTIPASLGGLKRLTSLELQGNGLSGTPPEDLGQLSELSLFDVSFNQLTGTISTSHFLKLTKLNLLHLSSNSFILDVGSDWIPPFQLTFIDLRSCLLGPSFPSWLKTQVNTSYLDISNASISDTVPYWFWDVFSSLALLNVSHNQLEGTIPNPLRVAPFADVDFSYNLFHGQMPLPGFDIELLDLSNNQFSGPIPRDIGISVPSLIFLSVSSNKLTGEIPDSIGEMLLLQVLDLSQNKLSGGVPSSIDKCSLLKALDLSYNNLTGVIPQSLGKLDQLQSLHLRNNHLFDQLPTSFLNLSSLQTLDLSNNKLSGLIPSWIGSHFPELRILNLGINAFSGDIPSQISNLSSLQVLNLAENNLKGEIPSSLGDLKAMAQRHDIISYLFYGKYQGLYYQENMVINLNNVPQKYTKTLSLLTCIDLSGNNLEGEMPETLTRLRGLLVLNLSRNHISGRISENMSVLRELSSLDLSSNELSGAIPMSMSSLSFLSFLNLSSNNLSGKIPLTGQIGTFSLSSFVGNPNLCGEPLPVKCPGDGNGEGGAVGNGGISKEDSGEHEKLVDQWFYLSIGLGFAAGILVPYIMLAMRKPWAAAYFELVDKLCQMVSSSWSS